MDNKNDNYGDTVLTEHTKHRRVHSARCTHAYITQLYIMSIQPVNKAAEHLINSTPVMEEEKKLMMMS